MKLIYTLIISVFTTSVIAQNCSSVVSNIAFQTAFNQIAVKPNDQAKLEQSYTLLEDKCLTASQVKLVASLFGSEAYKLEFTKTAYDHTFDVINFYDVYDVFENFSTAFRLHDYVNGISDTAIPDEIETETEEVPDAPATVTFPSLNYPSPVGYAGWTGCGVPIADSDFNLLVQGTVTQPTDEAKMQDAVNLMSQYCLSMAQVMKIATQIQMESNRLQFLKNVFMITYDMENYSFAIEVFSHVPYQNDWLTWCATQITDLNTPDVPPCNVTEERFESMKSGINGLTWSSDKEEALFGFINDEGNCFTIEQIKWFVNYFSFDDDKLNVMKSAYARCLEQNDYYKLAEELTFSSSKDDFFEWLD